MEQSVALSWVNIFVMLSIAVVPGILTFIVGFFLLRKTVTDVVDSLKAHAIKINELDENYHQLQVNMLTVNKDQIEAFMSKTAEAFANVLQTITTSNGKAVDAMLELTRSNVEVVQSNIRAEDAVKRIHERLDIANENNSKFQQQMIQNFRSTTACEAMMKGVKA